MTASSGRTAKLLMDIYERLYRRHGPQGWWPSDGPFETIAGAILTQNAAWANAKRALDNLRDAEALSPSAIRSMPEPELALLIRPSGYFNTKARKLKAIAEYMAAHGDDPTEWDLREPKELRAELLGVYGIGPETADDIVLYVAGLPSFVIDAYTRRVVDRLGLAPRRQTYEGYQALFEEHLPAEAPLFNEFHALLDHHAVHTCTKAAPRCEGCCLLEVCPTGKASLGGRAASAGPRPSARRASAR